MNLRELRQKFGTQKQCLEHLVNIRWDGIPQCPDCLSLTISKTQNTYEYHCNRCNKNFSVLTDTIFEETRLPLPDWFLIIAIMLNSPMGVSAKEIQRLTGVTYKTAWYSAMRVRCAMLDQSDLLEDIVEMDEAYIGGKPRKRNKRNPDDTQDLRNVVRNKRGRGTKKSAVVGIVERGGRVKTKVMDKLSSRNLMAMLRRYVNADNSIVITDDFGGYRAFDKAYEHLVIDHKKEFAKGIIHTNTIEGFWSILKQGIKGNYRSVSKKYLPFYLAEYSYKYGRRKSKSNFLETIEHGMEEEKCLFKYKPKKDPKQICHPLKKKRHVR